MQIIFAATIATCFALERNCALLAIDEIEAAQHEILVNAYAFTTGSGIPGALIRGMSPGSACAQPKSFRNVATVMCGHPKFT
jgi:hypothetical protein